MTESFCVSIAQVGVALSIYRVGLGSLDVRGGYFYGDDHTFFTVRLLYNHFITMNIKDLQRQRLPWILLPCCVLVLKSTIKPLSCIQKRDKLSCPCLTEARRAPPTLAGHFLHKIVLLPKRQLDLRKSPSTTSPRDTCLF